MDFAEFRNPGSAGLPLGGHGLAAGERLLSFEDLFDLDRIQHLQDRFADATRVASVITRPDGVPITRPSNFTRLCRDIIGQSDKGKANCRWSDGALAWVGKKAANVQPCRSGGLWDAGAPIVVEGRHIASWFVGQVRDETQTEERIRCYALEIDADPDEAVRAFREVPALARWQFDAIAQAVFTLADQLSTIAYQNLRQSRILAEREEAERALRASQAELKRRLQVSDALAALSRFLIPEANSIEAIAHKVLFHARHLTQSEHGFVSEIDPVTRENVGYTLTEMMGRTCRIEGTEKRIAFPPRADGTYPALWGHALNTGKGLFTNAPDAHSAATGIPEGHVRVRNFLTVPVMSEGAPIGQIALANATNGFESEDLEAIERIADLFAIAIVRSRKADEHRRVEAKLHEAQKMEAVGQLTGGVAHDFNNLLAIINGNLEMIEMAGGGNSAIRTNAANALAAVERGSALTHRLLAFSRRQSLVPRNTDLGLLVSDISEMLRRALGETIDLRIRIGDGLWLVLVDPHQLESAILNLALNARDAMPDGGVLDIAVENTHVGADAPQVPGGGPVGDCVSLTVSDTGKGISPDHLHHVFEPFFTTKEVGKGSGLGLSMVYGFVEQSKGHIAITSEVGRGTAVSMRFPRCCGGKHESGTADGPALFAGQEGERILVVEDEASVRSITADILRREGYTVVEASDGFEALERLKEGRYNLLFTDVVLPKGLSGIDVAVKAEILHPGLKVLFTTGYARNEVMFSDRADGPHNVIPKPYRRLALLGKIRDILDG